MAKFCLRMTSTLTASGLLLLLALLPAPDADAAPGSKVGWIETADRAGLAPAPVKIVRQGKEIVYSEAEGLKACDKIRLVDSRSVVRITLSNAQRLILDESTPEVVVPCDSLALAAAAVRLLQAIIGDADARRVAATTRTAMYLEMPILVADKAVIASGNRSLYVAWRGGVAPFSVEILRQGGKEILVSQRNIAGHAVRLPQSVLATGQYTLVVEDAAGQGVREKELHVVAARDLPPMPKTLVDARLPENDRALFYADVLVGSGDGRFTLEALQKAAAISPQTPAAREWLKAWMANDLRD